MKYTKLNVLQFFEGDRSVAAEKNEDKQISGRKNSTDDRANVSTHWLTLVKP